jgi:hypothetical protein
MSKLAFNGDSGKTDEYGTLLVHQRLWTGEVAQGCAVVANASPDMGVRVQAGTLRIPTGTSPAHYWYEAGIDTASPGEALTVTTANPSNPRRDLVVAYIDKAVTRSTSFTNNSNSVLKLAVVAGTAAGSPSDPNGAAIQTAIGASNPYIILARVRVATNATQITNSDIDDLRTMMAIGGEHLATSAITLGYAERTSNFSTSSTSDTDVTSLSVTVNVPSGGRRCRITTFISHLSASGGGNATELAIKEGSTTLSRTRANNPSGSSTAITPPSYSAVVSAGSHTFKLTMKNDVATAAEIAAGATFPAYIMVEAI